jgi:hypothetical protein
MSSPRNVFHGSDGSVVIGRSASEDAYPFHFLTSDGIFTASHLVIGAISSAHHDALIEYERVRPMIRAIVQEGMLKHSGMLTAIIREAIPPHEGNIASIPSVLLLYHRPEEITESLAMVQTSLRIEIHQGSCGFFDSINANCIDFEQEVSMGRSIGVAGTMSSGTMGGYIYDTSTQKGFALTNGHVCAMDKKNELPELPMIIDGNLESVTINQNSDQDHAHSLKVTGETMEDAAERANEYGGLHQVRNDWESQTRSYHEEIKAQEREFGTVRRAEMSLWTDSPSGDGSQCWKDYGIIDPLPGRIPNITSSKITI